MRIEKLFLLASLIITGCNDLSSNSKNNSSTNSTINHIVSSNAKVIVLAGQSNAAGNAWVKEMPNHFSQEKIDEYTFGYDSVLINYNCENGGNRSFNEFVPTCLGQGSEIYKFGPEVGMAEKINEAYPNEIVYIIKFAVGGTNLYNQWNSPSSGIASGQCYRSFIPFVKDALEKIEEEGLEPEIEAFCWMQGESDADNQKAPVYYDRLSDFVGDFRDEFKEYSRSKGIGFIDAGISDCYVWALNKDINNSKKKFADESDINFYIDTQEMNLEYNKEPHGNVDIYHYDSDAMIELGHAFGEIVVSNFM